MNINDVPHRGDFARVLSALKRRLVVNAVTGCHEWTGRMKAGGYGVYVLDGRQLLTHRLMYVAYVGGIPNDPVTGAPLLVLHECDNPPCCNPAHLFLGTHKDNHDDMLAKGRRALMKGIANGRAVLTEDDVRAIFNDPRSAPTLGDIYGVTPGAILHIKHRRTWSHLNL